MLLVLFMKEEWPMLRTRRMNGYLDARYVFRIQARF
jgi:hypothetical protein